MTIQDLPTAIIKSVKGLVAKEPNGFLFITKVRRIPPMDCAITTTFDWRSTDASFGEVVEELRTLILIYYSHIHLQLWVGKSSTSYNIFFSSSSEEALPDSCPTRRVKMHLPNSLVV